MPHYLLVGMILKLLNLLIFTIIFMNHLELFNNPIDQEGVGFQIIFGVIVGPILETYLFQALIINFADNLLSFKAPTQKFFVIGLSALLFAAIHYYSWAYQLAMLLPGIIFAYGYWYFRRYRGQAIAFCTVCSLHILYNLFVTCLDFLLP